MPKTTYAAKKFTPAHQQVIDRANSIVAQYEDAGMNLTLRQVYYQFVARDWLENKQTEYKRLGEILQAARMAGQMDWLAMIDRTRNLKGIGHHKTPEDLIEAASKSFHPDLWKDQQHHVEVWIEKDAGIGVIEGVCQRNDINYFSCRGYVSASEMWSASQRLRFAIEDGKQVTVLHIGDHDPSGVDMTRDITDRLRTFIHQDWAGLNMGPGQHTRGSIKTSMRQHLHDKGAIVTWADPWQVKRIALTIDQIETYEPPPNPAKQTDSRFLDYQEQTGLDESWELDALDPFVLQDLIQDEIELVRDEEKWDAAYDAMLTERATLAEVHKNWAQIARVHRPKTEEN